MHSFCFAFGIFQQNVYWKDALKILKLVVTRSSTLQVVPQGSPGGTSHYYYGSFSDSEVFCKKVRTLPHHKRLTNYAAQLTPRHTFPVCTHSIE